LKARQVAGGNKQRGYIMKEDASSPTVSSEAVMLTCIVNANENREVAIVDIPSRLLSRLKRTEHISASVVHWLISWCLLHLMSMDRM